MNARLLDQLTQILGPDGVRTTPAQKAVYASDAYTLEKALPGLVALPTSTEQVVKLVKLCAKENVAIVPRGAGTGLAGGAMARPEQVLLCLSRLNKIINIDIPNRRLRAQAGAVNTHLSKAVAAAGFQYAPDPSSQGASTIGGNIANNAGGPHTLKYGVTVNHILGVQVVLPDGEIVELSTEEHGYDLTGVVCGSEGTLGIVTEATVRLVKTPPAIRTLLAVCESVAQASQLISDIIGAGIVPAALEMIDQTILTVVEETYKLGLPIEAGAVLLIEVDGPEAGIDRQAERIAEICKCGGAMRIDVASDAKTRAQLWMARKKAVGTLGRLAPSHATQDGVAPRTKLPAVLAKIAEIARAYDLKIANVFHAGDGNLHPVVLFDERNPDEVKRVLAAGGEILKACVEAGGTLTGEHGIGIEKQDFLKMVFTDEDIDAMLQVRQVFNPNGLLNPGKLFPAGATCCPHLPGRDHGHLAGIATRAAGV